MEGGVGENTHELEKNAKMLGKKIQSSAPQTRPEEPHTCLHCVPIMNTHLKVTSSCNGVPA